MAKIDLSTISSGYNLSKINENFQKVEDALNNEVLYRDNPVGENNALQTDVDANNKRILNLPDPISANEPARKQDLDVVLPLALQYRDEAEASKNAAATSAANARASELASAASAVQSLTYSEDSETSAQSSAASAEEALSYVDIAANLLAQAEGSTIYQYIFVDEVLGDKYKFGSLFNESDYEDLILGRVYDGTATPEEIAAIDLLNQRLGLKAV